MGLVTESSDVDRLRSHPIVGSSAAEFVRTLVERDATISAVHVGHVRRPTLSRAALIQSAVSSHYEWQAQIKKEGASSVPSACHLIQAAVQRQEAESAPSLWDAILREVLENPSFVKTEVFRAAGAHDFSVNELVEVSRAEVLDGVLAELAAKPKDGKIVVISSMVKLSSEEIAHIPMIDFACPDTPEAREVLPHVAAELGEEGALVASGTSYHFYGLRCVSGKRRVQLLGAALLFQPIVDTRWVAHAVLETASNLRLSRHEETNEYPTVIDVILNQ